MKSDDLLEIIGESQDDYILDAKTPHRKSTPAWVKWTAMAACVCLILGMVWFFRTPIYPNASYTAYDFASMFPKTNATNAYTQVYFPNGEYMRLAAVPEAEYLPIYRYDDSAAAFPDRAEYEAFVSRVVTNYYNALNMPVPDYVVEESKIATGSLGYELAPVGGDQFYLQAGQFYLHSSAISTYTRFVLDVIPSTIGSQDPTIRLNGHAVQADQRQTDEEILASLENVKSQLFEIYGVSFSDAKVTRSYGGYSQYGVSYLSVYYYDEEAHPLNAYSERPVSDYIKIHFDNMMNFAEDIVSDTILSCADIEYMDYSESSKTFYPQIANAKMITLAEAEALLYKGYVFGGHSCPLCMAAQDKINFEGYDYVGFEYVCGYTEDGKRGDVVPFYAFYKAIGTSENGNIIYAKTYVPAIEVSGLDTYFRGQMQSHDTP